VEMALVEGCSFPYLFSGTGKTAVKFSSWQVLNRVLANISPCPPGNGLGSKGILSPRENEMVGPARVMAAFRCRQGQVTKWKKTQQQNNRHNDPARPGT
jgi:hypothetical protein